MIHKNKTTEILLLTEYMVWFLIFMLIESFANTRVGEVIGTDKVELLYGVFMLFTAMGFFNLWSYWKKN